MSQDWSIDEVRAAVAAYFDLLEQELRDERLNKSAARRRLNAILQTRTPGAIERKHQNISAIMIELGYPPIAGYKPLYNYQRLLADVVRAELRTATSLIAAIQARTEQPLGDEPSMTGNALVRPVDMPVADARATSMVIADRRRVQPVVNYLEREARNRELGAAGEKLTLRFEVERLRRAGKQKLADRVEHVSRTRGDAEGYDVLSFDETGRERLIEVKTTTFGSYTPFFCTPNEVRVSETHADRYYVYRLFDFRHERGLFVVPGAISANFVLGATQFAAKLR